MLRTDKEKTTAILNVFYGAKKHEIGREVSIKVEFMCRARQLVGGIC